MVWHFVIVSQPPSHSPALPVCRYLSEGSLLLGGDGRYFNDKAIQTIVNKAIQTIVKIGVAAGVKRFCIATDGLMSTPAISATIREKGPVWQKAFGAFILTASHNPGGPEEDFG
jgi:phosphoglucomutase